ncbi:30S ribosomal protein S2 [Patescibacteria group bacterium]|nr:30S ribosomal protein S2 [Patescibacteria group bacterium]
MVKNLFSLNIQDMEKANVQFGHRVSKLHPKMKQYVSGIKNSVHTIDLEKTVEEFDEALKFIEALISEGKNMLLVGTKVPIKALIKENAEICGLPYVNERWLGGAFTNFETILKRVTHFKDLLKQKEVGGLEKYTKKEKMKIEKEIESLRIKFEGVKDMQKLPEAVLVLDMNKDGLAAREAKRKGIKIIAVCDTNIDPSLADYPIPANDDSISSAKYILEKIKEVVLKAKEEVENKRVKE